MSTKHVLLILITPLFFAISSFSQRIQPWQNPDFGADSLTRIECAYNLSTMSEFMKINLPDYALPSWRVVFEKCPSASKNIYILGARIFSHKIESTEDPEMRKAYFDTLMIIYDKRIENFNEEGIVLGRKAMDIIKFGGPEAYVDAYPVFKKSAVLMEGETETNVLIGLSETGYGMYRADKIGITDFLEDYVLLTDIIEKQMTDTRMRSRANMASQRVEANLADAGINNCEEIEKVFKTRIEKNPTDLKTLTTVSTLLKNAACDHEVFYHDVFLNLFNLSPSSEISAELSKYYLKNDDYINASEYFIKSYELEENTERKSQYAMQVSILLYSRLSKYKEAVEYALIASELCPDWAEPYFALAPSYIEGFKQCTNEPFDRMAIFWLAADLMEKAAQVDPSSADRAKNQLNEYKRFFPSKEESFFRSLQTGSTYSFGCWINRSTAVRFN